MIHRSRGGFPWRWASLAALLGVEYLALSLLVDFPSGGATAQLIQALRIAVPVVLGAAAGAYLLSRQVAMGTPAGGGEPMPVWRPWPALAFQPLAFAATAVVSYRLMGPTAPAPGVPALLAWGACVGATALVALASAAPLPWYVRQLRTRWRAPLLALAIGLLSWRAATAAEGLWGVLSSSTLRLVALVVRAWAGDVTVDPAARIIGLRDFAVDVAPVCSGADGIGLVVMFQAVWLSIARERVRLGGAALLLASGALAAFAANVLRIAVLLLVGASGHEALALGGFHSKLGWLLFVVIALATIAVTERVWRAPPPASAVADLADAESACVAPLVAAVAAALVTGLWSDGGVDRLYGVRVAAAALTLVLLRRSLPIPSLSFAWPPVAIGLAIAALWIAWPSGEARAFPAALAALSPPGRWAWVVVRAVGACLVIPVVEELAFRQFLLGWLGRGRAAPGATGDRAAWAIAASSLAFGALHANWLLGAVAGVAFALARTWRGRLVDAIVAHAVANAGLAAAVLLGGRWDLWS